MKKIASVLALTVVAAMSNAVVTSCLTFPTFPFWTEKFDTITSGAYNTLSVFSGWGNASRIGSNGAMVVRPIPAPPSIPNVLYGDAVDIRIVTVVPMKRFGGFFKAAPIGVMPTMVGFKFYDWTSTLIGTVAVPLTSTWQWIGWQTTPMWSRVEIYGNIPTFPGAVAMDTLTMRPW
jgi:hypothetical protein